MRGRRSDWSRRFGAGVAAAVGAASVRTFALPSASQLPRGALAAGVPDRFAPGGGIDAHAALPTVADRFCGGSQAALRLLCLALGARSLFRGVTALAAEKRVRRRRRKAPPKSEFQIREEKREMGVLARDLAVALKVSDEDIRKRREERRKKQQKEREMDTFEADPIWNLNEGEDSVDPNIFGFPFIWVQLGHIILGVTLVAAAAVGGNNVEFALFDLPDWALNTLRTSLSVAVVINVVNAVITYFEEKSIPDHKNFDASGWFLKGVVLGGVASWQRLGRLDKVDKKARDKEIDEVIDALKSQPDGTPKIVERIGDQGKILTEGELKEKKLLQDKTKDRLLKRDRKSVV